MKLLAHRSDCVLEIVIRVLTDLTGFPTSKFEEAEEEGRSGDGNGDGETRIHIQIDSEILEGVTKTAAHSNSIVRKATVKYFGSVLSTIREVQRRY